MEKSNTPYSSLFSSIIIGSMVLKNKIGVAPMTRTSATEDGVPTEEMIKYYTRYAEGGFGLIITEGAYPDEKYSQGYRNQPGIANGKHIQGWRKVTDSVHKAGAKIFCQLMHAGALSQGNIYENKTVAPSAVQPKGEQLTFYGGAGSYPMPEEMSKEDIQDVVHGFTKAALNAREAGFDGVEIHGANGYLLDQFLTDYTNQRADEYGGDVENRVRLFVDVIREVREAVGANFHVGIRVSQSKVNDYTYKWPGKEADAEIIFRRLAQAAPDFIHVTEFEAYKPAFEEGGPTLAALAKRYGRLPVFVNGSLNDPKLGEDMLQQGDVDVVTVGKGALANKDWPKKVAAGEPLAEFNPEKFFSPNAKIKDFEY